MTQANYDERDDLMIAFDDWEAAADSVHLLMVDQARGVPVDQARLAQARQNLSVCQSRWDALASRVQNRTPERQAERTEGSRR